MRLTDQAIIITAGRVAEKAIVFIASLFLVRLLTRDQYGTYLQVSLISQLAVTVLLFGLPPSLLYFVPRADPAHRRQVIAKTAWLIAALALVGSAVVGAAGPLLGRYFNNEAIEGLSLLIGVYTFFYALDRSIDPVIIALGEARLAGLMAIGAAVLGLAGTLIPAWMGWGVRGIYMGLLAVACARIAYAGGHLARLPGAGPGVQAEGFSVPILIAFAVPMGLSAIATQYNRMLDGIVVSMMFPPADYAVYARGAFELPVVDLIPFTLANVILPRLVGLWKADDRLSFLALWRRSLRVSALFIFPTFAYGMLFAGDLIVTLFTSVYGGSTPIFRVYLCGLPLRLTHYAILLQATGETRPILRATGLSLAVNLLLAPLLCRFFGPTGAAAGFVASQFVLACYLLVATRKRTSFGLTELIPWGALARISLAAVAPAVLVRALALFVPMEPLVRLLLTAPVYALLLAGAYLRFGGLGIEERREIDRWLARLPFRRGASGGSTPS
jgi:O-antigen/teichoic acid export membrane protein